MFPHGRGIGGSAVAVILDRRTNSSDGPDEQDVTVLRRRTLLQGRARRRELWLSSSSPLAPASPAIAIFIVSSKWQTCGTHQTQEARPEAERLSIDLSPRMIPIRCSSRRNTRPVSINLCCIRCMWTGACLAFRQCMAKADGSRKWWRIRPKRRR